MISWTFDFISCQALATLETTQIASDNVAGTEDALLTFEQLLVELKSASHYLRFSNVAQK